MEKVLIGMSGGVDSSVAALLLKNKGYEVIGVTIDVWQPEAEDMASIAIQDAKKVCDKLQIKHIVVDYKKGFKESVIDRFAREYMAGRTPNPCNICNRYVKFEVLLNLAKDMGINYIATGHYASVGKDETTDRYYIKRCKADLKDQTYALYDLTQEQLSHVLMPLAEYTKEEVRDIAIKNNLVNASKKDSQEICFVPDKDYAKYIEEQYNYKAKTGDFVDTKGLKLGKHKGIVHYTVGQRKGLGLSLKQPMYVVKLDIDNNNVVLGLEEELNRKTVICKDVNFMLVERILNPIRVKAKIRYNAKAQEAIVSSMEDGKIKVEFDLPVKGVAPGQACVFYLDDIVLAGGIII